MKILYIIPFLLVGCASMEPHPPTIVKVPVWTPPKFEKPIRPTLRDSTQAKTEGQVVRDSELNMLDMMKYAEELETIVDGIK